MATKKESFGKITIEDIFTIEGRGTVITGKVSDGTFNLNDKVLIAGFGIETQESAIKGIEMFNKLLKKAKKDDNIGILLEDIDANSIRRWQLVTNCLDQEIVEEWAEKNAAAYVYLGCELFEQGNKKKAEKAFERAIELDPNMEDKIEAWKENYSQSDDDDDDENEEDDDEDENPEVRAHIEKGNAFREKEKYDKAIEEYTAAIEIEPENTDAISSRGCAHSLKEEYGKARSDYKKCISLITADPDYGEDELTDALSTIYVSLAQTYYFEHKFERSLQAFTKAIEINDKAANAYEWRGYAHYVLGNEDEAEDDFEQAIDLDEEMEDVIKNFKNTALGISEYLWDNEAKILKGPCQTPDCEKRAVFKTVSDPNSIKNVFFDNIDILSGFGSIAIGMATMKYGVALKGGVSVAKSLKKTFDDIDQVDAIAVSCVHCGQLYAYCPRCKTITKYPKSKIDKTIEVQCECCDVALRCI